MASAFLDNRSVAAICVLMSTRPSLKKKAPARHAEAEEHDLSGIACSAPPVWRKGGLRMPPLSFTDEELDSLTELASALPPSSRDGFLQMVAGKLSAYPADARGPGLVHRIAAEAQRDLLKGAPIAVGSGGKCGRSHFVRSERR